jgi:hypothetical protein
MNAAVTKSNNPLRKVHELGQSIWLDDIRRGWLRDGHLARLIADDAVAGVTSNPAIFAKSISEGAEYNEGISALARAGRSIDEIYETLALEDVQAAASSAWKSRRIWPMTLKVQSRRDCACGRPSTGRMR